MPRKGRDLELLVKQLEEVLAVEGVEITSPDYILGVKSKSRREIDVSVRSEVGSLQVLIIFECRDRQDTEDVRWIEQLAKKREDVQADMAVAVSSSGFSTGAVNTAVTEGIELRTLQSLDPIELRRWLRFDSINYHALITEIHHVHLNFNPDHEFSDASRKELEALLNEPLNLDAPLFERQHDDFEGSIIQIWKTAVPMNDLFKSVKPDDAKVKYRVRVEFPEKRDRYQFCGLHDCKPEIVEIEFHAELWIEKTILPLKGYSYGDGNQTIFEGGEFDVEHEGNVVAVGIVRHEGTNRYYLTLRRKQQGERPIHVNVTFVPNEEPGSFEQPVSSSASDVSASGDESE